MYTSDLDGRTGIFTYRTCGVLTKRGHFGGDHFGGGDVGGDVAEVVMEMVQHDVGEMSTQNGDP